MVSFTSLVVYCVPTGRSSVVVSSAHSFCEIPNQASNYASGDSHCEKFVMHYDSHNYSVILVTSNLLLFNSQIL